MRIIAKCVNCKKEYEQIYCNNKFCALCKVLNEKKATKAYNLKLSILKKSRIVKCKLCKKDTSGYYNRIYCESCRIISRKISTQSTNIKKYLFKKSRIIQCKLCQKDTDGYYGRVYCDECKIIKINVKNIKPHLFKKSPIAQCKYCHKETQVYRGRPRLYCDKECLDKYRSPHKKLWYRKKHPLKKKKCKVCGCTISPRQNKVCGVACYERRSKYRSIKRFKDKLSNHFLAIPKTL